MTDGQAAEPPQGTPSTRALGAMESAVRRAREAAGGAPPPPPPPQRAPARALLPPRRARQRPAARSLAHRRRRRRHGAGRRRRHRSRRVARHRHTVPECARPVLAGHDAGPRRRLAPRPPPIRDGRRAPCRRPPRRRHDDDHGAGGGPRAAAPVISALSPSSGIAGRGRPGRRFELPELERPDRGHVQRSGGLHELPHAEHLHRHGPAVDGLSVRAGDDHHRQRHLQCGDLHLRLNVLGGPQRLGLAAPRLREEPEERGRGRRRGGR